MQATQCNCPLNSLQQTVDQLNRDTLPFDKILQIGTDFTTFLQTALSCGSCITQKRISNTLTHITLRLVCFYKAAYSSAVANLTSTATITAADMAMASSPTTPISPYGRIDSSSSATQRAPGCHSVPREMKFGELVISGLEGRMLVKVVLVDACLELNRKMEEWQAMMHEALEAEDEAYLAQYDTVIGRCLNRLVKLIGLLQLDGLSVERS
ncbi:hypothetical protein NA57DRAFT_69595 [Rhizodiscina lignyota]|uniref:Uncharacterized protein n=1 Tax=Rhizodiscina lignyota TaxID=1504668 RepID=A0A9P4M0T9_9PEZI|nr:hypothetical protein NA57DRAFT_69595 [Rhizodiscina lignyota]